MKKYILLFFDKKKIIIGTTVFITVVAIIISLILPETFVSTTVILPDTDKGKLSGLGGLSDLASMAGVTTGDISPIKLFPSILKSESVLRNVIYKKYKTSQFGDSVNLIQFWGIKAKSPALEYEIALKSLRTILNVDIDIKTNIITASVESTDPQLSADILNSITAELDIFMRTKRATNATKQRQWIEARLVEVKDELCSSENNLKIFRERNHDINGSPQLILEQERLFREVQINGTLFSELRKQFELVKIEEIKNTAIVNIMDSAIPAAKKTHPQRGNIVMVSFFCGLVLAFGYVYIMDRHGDQIKNTIKSLTIK